MRIAPISLRLGLLGGLLLLAVPAHAQFGVFAGLNFDDFDDIETDSRDAAFESASGYHFGLFFEYGAGPLAVRPGVLYRQINDGEFTVSDAAGVVTDFDVSLIEVFADLKVGLPLLPIVQPYAFAGPVVGFPSSSDDDFDEALADAALWGNIGLGVDVGLVGVRLQPEIRYSLGLSRFTDEEITIGGVSLDANEAQNLNSFMIRLGVVF